MWFSTKARLSILRLPLDLWCWNVSGSDLGSWFRVTIGPARRTRQTLIVNFTVYLEKCNFLQMILNIGKLYTIGKHFSSQVWIRDRYLKIKICLAWIHLQSSCFFMEKCAENSGTFVGNGGYHLEEKVEMNLLEPGNGGESIRRTAFEHCPATAPSCATTAINNGVLPLSELDPASLAPSEANWTTCVAIDTPLTVDRV